MKVLGIETSTQICSVGLVDETGFISDYRLAGKTIHAEHLALAANTVLEDASWENNDLDGLSISIGPGSFTGLRIGLGFVKGLAFGLDIPVIAVPTMDGLVAQVADTQSTVCVLMIARRGEVYRTVYRNESGGWKLMGTCQALADHDIFDDLSGENVIFVGEGATRSKDEIIEKYGSSAYIPEDLILPSGYWIASLGRQRLLLGEKADIDSLIPQYFKRFQGVA